MASYYIADTTNDRAFKQALDAGLLTKYKYRNRSSAGQPLAQDEYDSRCAAGFPTAMWRIDTNDSRAVLMEHCNM